MFTHQTLIKALKNDDICAALKNIEPTCIQLLMQQGVSVLHLVLEAILSKIISQLNVLTTKADDGDAGFIPDPNYVLLLTRIIKADPSALYKKFNGKKLLEILSNFDVNTHTVNTTIKHLLARHATQIFPEGVSRSWDDIIEHSDVGLSLKKSVTGLALFLLEQGAGIGNHPSSVLMLNKLYLTEQTFLYLGTFYWYYQHQNPSYMIGKQDHYYALEGIASFSKSEKLSKETKLKLLLQAERGKQYAGLDPTSKQEVDKLQDVINFLYTSELTTLFLQVIHQVVNLSPALPLEIMMHITGYMLVISQREALKLYEQKVQQHAKKLQTWGCLKSLGVFKTKLNGVIEIDIAQEEQMLHSV